MDHLKPNGKKKNDVSAKKTEEKNRFSFYFSWWIRSLSLSTPLTVANAQVCRAYWLIDTAYLTEAVARALNTEDRHEDRHEDRGSSHITWVHIPISASRDLRKPRPTLAPMEALVTLNGRGRATRLTLKPSGPLSYSGPWFAYFHNLASIGTHHPRRSYKTSSVDIVELLYVQY